MNRILFSSALAALLALAGCNSARKVAESSAPATGCTTCHGSGDDPAPPVDAHNSSTSPAVGAHQAHVHGDTFTKGVPCSSCHVVPTSASDHSGTKLVFSGLGAGTQATSDASGVTCSNVYCHGATLSGGTQKTVTWTMTGLSGCDSCHGNPPPETHSPAMTSCATCHAGAVHVNGEVEAPTGCTGCHGGTDNQSGAPPRDVAGSNTGPAIGAHTRHVSKGVACASCHKVPTGPGGEGHADGGRAEVQFLPGSLALADGAQPAYAEATQTCSSVYCHGSTRADGKKTTLAWGDTISGCEACHGFPPTSVSPHSAATTNCSVCHPVGGPEHVNGTVDVTVAGHTAGFSNPAQHGPAAIANLGQCAGCHGATFDGGIGPSCNACHQSAGWNASALRTNCTFCHGTKTKPDYVFASNPPLAAPPQSVAGETDPTQPTVGAHQAHLQPGLYQNGVGCEQCHTPPGDLAHVDGQAATLTWGPIAKKGNTPSWSGAPGYTCTNYCHGATLSGGVDKSPAWTSTSLPEGCQSCHGYPPTSLPPHTSTQMNCGLCHPAAPGPSHVNGTVDLTGGACTACHGGTDNQTGAPPKDVAGNTSSPAVGAHTKHLDSGVACSDCHVVPSSIRDPGHADGGQAEVTFSGKAIARGAQPTYDYGSHTCANAYCHERPDGTRATIAWNGAPITGCTSCHGFPPLSIAPHTSATADCTVCHPVGGPEHVNGVVNVTAAGHTAGFSNPAEHGPAANAGISSCAGCHGADFNGSSFAPSCNACHAQAGWNATALTSNCTFCHGTKTKPSYTFTADPKRAAPPESVAGATAATDPTVGAHQAHLTTGTYADPLACSECHPVPANLSHVNGTKVLQWGSTAAKDTTPTWSGAPGYTCTNYCHGATLQGGTQGTVTWTGAGSLTGCTPCHGSPPPTGSHLVHGTRCSDCHRTVMTGIGAITNKALHVNGQTDISLIYGTFWPGSPGVPPSCSSVYCHEDRDW